ncbi:hypothetical protein E4U42_003457 [Claviceps africana]|uniref:Life-span regulatory factor n=1 Tax=Claviceps africana TaxID=83212 RepID=A0A8K0J6K2_9HYPO|nr:hypothetical protein E4U42_003457 [Claviceps africana]
MACDSWAHQFCLACDKQIQSDGAAYCSEACRLADQEKNSAPSSQAASPTFTPSGYPWSSTLSTPIVSPSSSPSKSGFYLSPAYDFSNGQSCGPIRLGSPSLSSNLAASVSESSAFTRHLSPSSSYSSLCSIQSTATMGETDQLSDTAKQELKAYAISFEHVRLQRRRSH